MEKERKQESESESEEAISFELSGPDVCGVAERQVNEPPVSNAGKEVWLEVRVYGNVPGRGQR